MANTRTRFKWARAFRLLEKEQKARNRKLKNLKKKGAKKPTFKNLERALNEPFGL